MRHTSNLGLTLFSPTDKMNVTGLNDSMNANMEIIDNLVDRIVELEKNANSINANMQNVNKLEDRITYLELNSAKNDNMYSNLTNISRLARSSSVDRLRILFPVGDQITVPWKDMDDSNHNTDETAYKFTWNIVHHDTVTLSDGTQTSGIFLQMHNAAPRSSQFSHPQAIIKCANGLSSGTYNITFGDNTISKTFAPPNTTWQFTLTKSVPAGGLVSGFEDLDHKYAYNCTIKTWASADSDNPIEEVSVASGNAGVGLGVMEYKKPIETGTINNMRRVVGGHNRWSTSALRQYLNSKGNKWWKSVEEYDIRPDQYDRYGFMSGFNNEFLSALRPIKVTTALNSTEGFLDKSEDTFDTFFAPSAMQMNVKGSEYEGPIFDYWRVKTGSNELIQTGSQYTNDAFKVSSLTSNSAVSFSLRTPNTAYSDYIYHMTQSGSVSTIYDSTSAYYMLPVCVIC